MEFGLHLLHIPRLKAALRGICIGLFDFSAHVIVVDGRRLALLDEIIDRVGRWVFAQGVTLASGHGGELLGRQGSWMWRIHAMSIA